MFCGSIAVMFAATDQFENAAIFVLLGIFFDFFDGLVARWLDVRSDFGVELDSLADMVTSGLVPGVVMYKMLAKSVHLNYFDPNFIEISVTQSIAWVGFQFSSLDLIPLIGLCLTLAAAYRLAKFNLDDRQKDSFVGLPVPAMALFMLSLPIIQQYSDKTFITSILNNRYVLIGIVLVFCYLMNAEIRLFSLKFKNSNKNDHIIPIVFLIVSIVLIIWLKLLAIPIIILTYVLFSLIKNSIIKS